MQKNTRGTRRIIRACNVARDEAYMGLEQTVTLIDSKQSVTLRGAL